MTDFLKAAPEAPDWVVLVSGWSFGSDMWQPVRDALVVRGIPPERILCVDWYALGCWLFDAGAPCPVPPSALGGTSVWCGWSLGGSLALEAMGQGAIVPRKLIVLSTTPRHLSEDDVWPGLSVALWRNLRRAVRRDLDAALAEFDAWAGVVGKPLVRNVNPDALLAGLDWLARIDRRAMLAVPPAPICWIYGSDDPLVPDADWPRRLAVGAANHYEIVPGARHDIPWTQTARVVSEII
ncbi:hypothetical protein A9404_06590 [Halothiobacillus diazotrophicus]|uniref:AB hydrolase-1 domain-containing protein n=1 Tax=Halothiobacillus diazotrophicus TaxID=1860122 RepID=A0A191ZGV7_9GAMM|nr:alpha/beta hydrolase [Halothiobacillus diazotrophicus]ANJ67095.1 hypothetical protein A9404_06590 [Halothiobacillus diazotrophicus]